MQPIEQLPNNNVFTEEKQSSSNIEKGEVWFMECFKYEADDFTGL